MKKKLAILVVSLSIMVSVALPVSAASDPNATTRAYINYVQGSTTSVLGKAYAFTTNPLMTSINVVGDFYQGAVKKQSGVATETHIGWEAAWYSSGYVATGSYTLNSASRTYYSGGSYDQAYAISATW